MRILDYTQTDIKSDGLAVDVTSQQMNCRADRSVLTAVAGMGAAAARLQYHRGTVHAEHLSQHLLR
jgi:hypothetical protein